MFSCFFTLELKVNYVVVDERWSLGEYGDTYLHVPLKNQVWSEQYNYIIEYTS